MIGENERPQRRGFVHGRIGQLEALDAEILHRRGKGVGFAFAYDNAIRRGGEFGAVEKIFLELLGVWVNKGERNYWRFGACGCNGSIVCRRRFSSPSEGEYLVGNASE